MINVNVITIITWIIKVSLKLYTSYDTGIGILLN
jgi:hypothetical protein